MPPCAPREVSRCARVPLCRRRRGDSASASRHAVDDRAKTVSEHDQIDESARRLVIATTFGVPFAGWLMAASPENDPGGNAPVVMVKGHPLQAIRGSNNMSGFKISNTPLYP